MDGFAIQAGQSIYQVEDTNWAIAGTGDFNGDGKSDILWRNKSTGQDAIWLMDGFAIQAAQVIYQVEGANWNIAGTGDFNGDGKSDILWRHGSSGQNGMWLMDGFTIQAAQFIYQVEDTNWTPVTEATISTFSNTRINGVEITGDAALPVVGDLGDTNRNGRHEQDDVTLTQRTVVKADNGLVARRDFDPLLVADGTAKVPIRVDEAAGIESAQGTVRYSRQALDPSAVAALNPAPQERVSLASSIDLGIRWDTAPVAGASGGASSAGASARKDWRRDFVLNLGQSEARRNANLGLKISLPVAASVSPPLARL